MSLAMPEAPYGLDGYPRNQEELTPAGMQPLGWIEINRGYERLLPYTMADATRPCVEGYLSTMSAAPGELVKVHASSKVRARLFLRAYKEQAAEHCVLELPLADPGYQPIREDADRNGAGWPECGSFTVPAEWGSGVYRLGLFFHPEDCAAVAAAGTAEAAAGAPVDSGGAPLYKILLAVRAPTGAPTSRTLLVLTTNTYLAYNNWGGHSLYSFHSAGGDPNAKDPDIFSKTFTQELIKAGGVQGFAVHPDRPGHGYYGSIEGRFPTWERQFVLFCEREGIAIDVATQRDVEDAAFLQQYKLVVTVGHDEYVSARQRRGLEAFVAGGGHFALLSGNTMAWQTRWSGDFPEWDGDDTPPGAMTCYKAWYKLDPALASAESSPMRLTTLYSHPLVRGPAQHGSENAFIGVGVRRGGFHRCHAVHLDGSGAFTITPDGASSWLTKGADGAPSLSAGDSFGGGCKIVGYEVDGCEYEMQGEQPKPTGADGTPREFVIVAQCHKAAWGGEWDCHVPSMEKYNANAVSEVGALVGVNGAGGGPPGGTATCGYTDRRAEGGGVVFAAGTTDWAYGLTTKGDPTVQTITRNLLTTLGR